MSFILSFMHNYCCSQAPRIRVGIISRSKMLPRQRQTPRITPHDVQFTNGEYARQSFFWMLTDLSSRIPYTIRCVSWLEIWEQWVTGKWQKPRLWVLFATFIDWIGALTHETECILGQGIRFALKASSEPLGSILINESHQEAFPERHNFAQPSGLGCSFSMMMMF